VFVVVVFNFHAIGYAHDIAKRAIKGEARIVSTSLTSASNRSETEGLPSVSDEGLPSIPPSRRHHTLPPLLWLRELGDTSNGNGHPFITKRKASKFGATHEGVNGGQPICCNQA